MSLKRLESSMLITAFPYICLPIVIITYIIIAMLFKIFDLKKRNQILQEEYEKAILREKQLLLLTIKLKRGLFLTILLIPTKLLILTKI